MTNPTVIIEPMVPDELQEEDEDPNMFYDARSEVSIGDIEAGYDEEYGGGNEEAAEEGVNDVDFDNSIMMAYCRALQQQILYTTARILGKKQCTGFL
jgi:hypothetical protein